MARPYVVADSFGGLEQAQLARDAARDNRFFNSLRQRLAERQQLNAEMAQRASMANDIARLRAASVAQFRDDQRRADQQAIGTALSLAELGDRRAGREDYQKQLEFQNRLAEGRFGLEQQNAQLQALQAAKYLSQPSRQELEQQMLDQEQSQIGQAAGGLAERLNELDRLNKIKLLIPEGKNALSEEINRRQGELEEINDEGFVTRMFRYPLGLSLENRAEENLAKDLTQLLPPELQSRGLTAQEAAKRLSEYITQQQEVLLPEIEGLQRSGLQAYITRDPATGAYITVGTGAGTSPSATGSLRSQITGRSPLNALPQVGDRRSQDGIIYVYNGLEWLPEERLGQTTTR